MKLIKTEDAVGQVLCHDITRIVKGESKGPVFKKGHIIQKEDIPVLLKVGKENIYIWENDETMLHENEAAEILFNLCKGENMHGSDISEGKIELIADIDGVLKVDREKIEAVNGFGEMMIASRHGNFPIKKGDKIAGTRIIPLVIEKEKMKKVSELEAPIFEIEPYKLKTAGVITTGSEIKKSLITDTFTPVIKDKLGEYGVEMVSHLYSGDDNELITEAILFMIKNGVDMVICTGGMSVDPDDKTPLAIKNTGADIVTYGAPVLPGAMFMLAYKDDTPIMGLPGCVMYSKRTVFDLALPRIVTGEKLTSNDFVAMGEGGLCLSCDICTFPNCGFGKGR
jgi:molybdenum cofactor synthesis domain-containing protein